MLQTKINCKKIEKESILELFVPNICPDSFTSMGAAMLDLMMFCREFWCCFQLTHTDSILEGFQPFLHRKELQDLKFAILFTCGFLSLILPVKSDYGKMNV